MKKATRLHRPVKRMRLLTVVLVLLTAYNACGQANSYQSLINTALERRGSLFVHFKPIGAIELSEERMAIYFSFHRDFANKILDTSMFAEIIHNAEKVDTAQWQESELKRFLLVKNRTEKISEKYMDQKIASIAEQQKEFYDQQVKQYNSANPDDRNVYYFSRPVFDNAKKFAIVQWDNAHSGLGGGGGIILYQLQGDTWSELGPIMNWKY